MKKKNNKGLMIFGLIALCVILTVGVFTLGQSPKGEDILQDRENPGIEVTPGGIDGNLASGDVPAINPGGITPRDPAADGQNGNDIPLTVIDDKPEPPELPDTALTWEDGEEVTPDDVQAYEELDPVLKNPDVKPNITPAPVQPNKPADNTPNSGDTNGNGQIYIPGFGWVDNEGGGGQGQPSGSDGDWDKQIGSMG